MRVSCLNLVDLAGSERISKSGATGVTRREGGMINTSLLTLGTVINKLITGERHIPYRDSKLTRLLSTSLGGNAKTAVVVTVSPAESNLGETRSSLQFAERAMRVVNTARVNEVTTRATIIERYRRELSRLRAALLEGRGGVVVTPGGELLRSEDVIQQLQQEKQQALQEADARRAEAEGALRKVRSGVDRVRFVALLALHACGRLESAGEAVVELARFLVNPAEYARSQPREHS